MTIQKPYKFSVLLFLLCSFSVFSQVKVGDNPSQIHPNSLLELESSNKALVISSMTSGQMNAIFPLQGALVYNTDENCVFVFEGSVWKSLCVLGTGVTTSTTAPTTNNEGDFWIDNSTAREVVNIWDGNNWIAINNNPKSAVGPPSATNPTNAMVGDIYVNETTGELYTYNGADWLNVSENGAITANNGITKTSENTIQLGGALTQPTEINTDPTNTLAITGIEAALSTDDLEVAVLDNNTGVLKKLPLSALNNEVQAVTFAVDGQTQFTTPYPVTNVFKIYVYRNGVRLGFTKVNDTTIELETGVFCYQDDEIRIVQKY